MKAENIMQKTKQERLAVEQQEFVQEMKMLMEGTALEEKKLLRNVGLDLHIRQAEKITEYGILNKQYSEKYQGTIFHIDEIRDLGMKYRLFMKPSRLYRGKIPNDLGAILLRLKKEHNMAMESESGDSKRFFMLAPPSMFTDYVTVGEKAANLVTEYNLSRKEFSDAMRDPGLFYKIDSEHYLLVKFWGADLSIGRRVMGFFTQTALWANLMIAFALLFSFYHIDAVYQLSMFISPYNSDSRLDLNDFLTIIGYILQIVATVFYIIFWRKVNQAIFNNDYSFRRNNPSQLKKFSTKHFWNTTFLNY